MSADFAMCFDDFCPARSHCWRHEASGRKAVERQTWANFDRKGADKACVGYWPVEASDG